MIISEAQLLETPDGDYVLSPAYDLFSTALHIDDGNLALQGGLYEKNYESPAFQRFGIYTYVDFILFAEKIGFEKDIAEKILKSFQSINNTVIDMIHRSFLSDKGKEAYEKYYREKCSRLLLEVGKG